MRKNDEDDLVPHLRGYVSVREAAEWLEVSERTVYGYIDEGRLAAVRIGSSLALEEAVVKEFQRQATGRPRTRQPVWRSPVGKNIQYLTVIFVRIREGQSDAFDHKLGEIRSGEQHLLPGTVARYISRGRDRADDVQMVLVWRSTVMPSEEEREASLEAFRSSLTEMLDWETAWSEEGQVVLHT